MIRRLHAVLTPIWHLEAIPPGWKGGLVVPIWKGKESRQDCDDYHVNTLLNDCWSVG